MRSLLIRLLIVLILLLLIFCIVKKEESSFTLDHSPLEEESSVAPTSRISEIEVIDNIDEDVNAIARTLYGECRGVPSDMEKAAVAWVILNRVDQSEEDTILDIVSEPSQFLGYDPDNPLEEELVLIAEDVLDRWYREKSGDIGVGRVIPQDYLWFYGDGDRNYFRNEYGSTDVWDWSLENPYD